MSYIFIYVAIGALLAPVIVAKALADLERSGDESILRMLIHDLELRAICTMFIIPIWPIFVPSAILIIFRYCVTPAKH